MSDFIVNALGALVGSALVLIVHHFSMARHFRKKRSREQA